MGLDKEKMKKAFSDMVDKEECKVAIFQTNCGGGISGTGLDSLTALDMLITRLAEDIPYEILEKSVNAALAVVKAKETGDITLVLETMKKILESKGE